MTNQITYAVHFCKEKRSQRQVLGSDLHILRMERHSENGITFGKRYSDLGGTQRIHLFATFSQNSRQEAQYPTIESNALYVLSSESLLYL